MQPDETRDGKDLLDLFVGGPSIDLQRLFRLGEPCWAHLRRRCLAVIATGWVVPLVLVAVRAGDAESGSLRSFALDFAIHARSLVAAPLFILAEVLCAPRLGAAAIHFLDTGIVPESERSRFDAIVRSTVRLRDARLSRVIVAIVAYAVVFGLLNADLQLPVWQRDSSGFSVAGWWHVLVSIPIVLVLTLGWVWLVFLWTRFLWLVSGLDLRLIPAHPDNAAGLRFLGYSLRAYSMVGFAFGTIVAGGLANRVARTGATQAMFIDTALVLVALVVLLFTAPLLVFLSKLLHVWRRGVLLYGGLASKLGREFEEKWFGENPGPALQVPDFSATIDLYSVVDYVYQMRFVPVDFTSLVVLIVVTLLPLVPVLFMGFPIEVLAEFAKLLF
jgi:hypothetical protein